SRNAQVGQSCCSGSGTFGDQGGRAELDSATGHDRGGVAAGEGRSSGGSSSSLGGRVEETEGRGADDEEDRPKPVQWSSARKSSTSRATTSGFSIGRPWVESGTTSSREP